MPGAHILEQLPGCTLGSCPLVWVPEGSLGDAIRKVGGAGMRPESYQVYKHWIRRARSPAGAVQRQAGCSQIRA